MILLKDFNDILARLPQISKDNFNSIPKLMDYICIVNPI